MAPLLSLVSAALLAGPWMGWGPAAGDPVPRETPTTDAAQASPARQVPGQLPGPTKPTPPRATNAPNATNATNATSAPIVQWESHAQCDAMSQLPARVELLLSRSPIEQPGMRVRAELFERRNQFVLELVFEHAEDAPSSTTAPPAQDAAARGPAERPWATQRDARDAKRELRGPSCEALVDAAALLIAFAVDPLVLDHAIKPSQPAAQGAPSTFDPPAPTSGLSERVQPEGQAPDGATPVAHDEGPDRSLRPRQRPGPMLDAPVDAMRASLSIRSTLGWGLTPALNFGVAIGGAWALRPRFVFAVGARHAFRRVQVVAGGTGGIGVQSPSAYARACVRGTPKVELLGCLGFEAGAIIASSADVVPASSKAAGWGASSALFGLRWPAGGRVALAIDLEGWVGLARPAFKFPGVTGAYRPDRVAGRAWVGADLRFGKAVTQKRKKAATEP